jgi:hypothetical protein
LDFLVLGWIVQRFQQHIRKEQLDEYQHCGVLDDIRSKTTLAFRLMPRMNTTIDCKAVAKAGHPLAKGSTGL